MNSKFKIPTRLRRRGEQNSKLSDGFTLMELMLTIALAALIISVAVPTFIDINRGASAKQANNLVYAHLTMAQQKATITRQRVGFYIVTQVLNNNPWVETNMANRSFFLFAADTPDVARTESFLTSVQTLPAPMMFDLGTNATSSSSTIPLVELKHPTTGILYFRARGFRFAPAGGLHAQDWQASADSAYKFNIVITEGQPGPGGAYAAKTLKVIKYTNTVNTYTGKVYTQR